MHQTYSIHTRTTGTGAIARHRVTIREGTGGELLAIADFRRPDDRSIWARAVWVARQLEDLKAGGTLAADAVEVVPVNGGKRAGAGRKAGPSGKRGIPVQVRFAVGEIADLDAISSATGKPRSTVARDMTLIGIAQTKGAR